MSSRSTSILLIIAGMIIGAVIGYTITPTGVSQQEYNNLLNENKALQSQVNQLHQNLTTLHSQNNELTNEVNQLKQKVSQLEGKTNTSETIKLAHSNKLGDYFTNASGYALYYFALDTPSSGVSKCAGECLKIWTPYYTERIIPPKGVNATNFSKITWSDGTKQITYRGWPLYLYNNDTSGTTKGEAFKNLWWVMKPSYTILLSYSEATGLHLCTFEDEGIYYFAKDIPRSGESACTGECTSLWSPVPGGVIAPSSAPAMNFSSFTGLDGAPQAEYRGWPLYTYNEDGKPGDTNGDGYKDLWYLMKPNYSIMIAYSSNLSTAYRIAGNMLYLTDGDGFTLYYNILDSPGYSTCTGDCLSLWTPYYVQNVIAPNSIQTADFTSFENTLSKEQLQYVGWPLYHYSQDKKPGETKGEGYLNVWYTIDPYNPPPAE